MKSATQNITTQSSKIKSAVSGIKSAIIGLAVGTGLYRLGKEAIQVASDITEVQNVVDVAFGNMAWKAERFAKSALESFGMSELSAKKTASTYMAMASGMGLGADKASDMAITMAGLTGDVASFFNISQELADVKLKSVFTGETETLKDLGIVMTQTNLQAYALSQGISKNVNDMSQAEITTLRYNYVLDQLSLAQGDFARTSNSWANQIRILQERFKQLLGIIGNGLIAALTPVVQFLNMVIGKLITFANVVSAVFSRLFGKNSGGEQAASGFTSASNAAKSATSSTGGLTNALKGTEEQAKKTAKSLGSLAVFDEINNISASNSSDKDTGGTAGGYAIDPIDWDTAFAEPDTSGINEAVDKAMGYINKFRDFLKKNAPIISSLLAGVLAGLIAFEVIKNWGLLVAPIKNLFANLSALFALFKEVGVIETLSVMFTGLNAPMLAVVVAIGAITAALVYLYQASETFRNIVNEAVTNLFDILNSLWSGVLQPLFAFIADVLATVLVPLGTLIAEIFVKGVEAVFTVVLSLWNNILAPLAKFLVDILSIALQGVIDIWTAWKPVIELIFTALNWLWDNVLSPLVDFIVGIFCDGFKSWGNLINELIPSVKELFQGLIDFFVGVFTLDLDKAWEGIKKIFNGFNNFLETIFSTDWSKLLGALGEPLNALCASISSIWEGIKKVFNGIITFITGVFSGNWRQAWEGIKDIFGGIFDMLAGLVKAPINAIISIINGIIDAINEIGFEVPDWVPFIGGKEFKINVPKLNYLAQGAVVDKATLGVLGEAGTEAVIPLKRNTQGLELIATKLAERLPTNEGTSGATYVINLVLENGKLLTRMVIDNIKEYEIQTGKPIFDY